MKGTLRKRCAAPSCLRRVGTEHSRTIHRPTPTEDEKAHVAWQGNFLGSHSIVEKVDSLLAGDVHGSSPNTSRDLRQARIVKPSNTGFATPAYTRSFRLYRIIRMEMEVPLCPNYG